MEDQQVQQDPKPGEVKSLAFSCRWEVVSVAGIKDHKAETEEMLG